MVKKINKYDTNKSYIIYNLLYNIKNVNVLCIRGRKLNRNYLDIIQKNLLRDNTINKLSIRPVRLLNSSYSTHIIINFTIKILTINSMRKLQLTNFHGTSDKIYTAITENAHIKSLVLRNSKNIIKLCTNNDIKFIISTLKTIKKISLINFIANSPNIKQLIDAMTHNNLKKIKISDVKIINDDPQTLHAININRLQNSSKSDSTFNITYIKPSECIIPNLVLAIRDNIHLRNIHIANIKLNADSRSRLINELIVNSQFKKITLNNVGLDTREHGLLSQMIEKNKNLKLLSVKNNYINISDFYDISKNICCHEKLENVNLSGNLLCNMSFVNIISNLKKYNKTLMLNMNNNLINDKIYNRMDEIPLGNIIKMKVNTIDRVSLKCLYMIYDNTLNLCDTHLSDSTLPELFQLLSHEKYNHVTQLKITNTKISEEGISIILDWVSKTKISTLIIGDCTMEYSTKIYKLLVNLINTNSTINKLTLECSGCKPRNYAQIMNHVIKSVTVNKNICEFDVGWFVNLPREIASVFYKKIDYNRVLYIKNTR